MYNVTEWFVNVRRAALLPSFGLSIESTAGLEMGVHERQAYFAFKASYLRNSDNMNSAKSFVAVKAIDFGWLEPKHL